MVGLTPLRRRLRVSWSEGDISDASQPAPEGRDSGPADEARDGEVFAHDTEEDDEHSHFGPESFAQIREFVDDTAMRQNRFLEGLFLDLAKKCDVTYAKLYRRFFVLFFLCQLCLGNRVTYEFHFPRGPFTRLSFLA